MTGPWVILLTALFAMVLSIAIAWALRGQINKFVVFLLGLTKKQAETLIIVELVVVVLFVILLRII